MDQRFNIHRKLIVNPRPNARWFKIAVRNNKYSGGPLEPQQPNPIAGYIKSKGRTLVINPYVIGSHQGTEPGWNITTITYKVIANNIPMI
jgi:hypothetical protein